MAHVRSVSASIAFYALLGFEVENTFVPAEREDPSWASLGSDRARLMLSKADEPVVASQHAVLFYVYCDDVAELRERLVGDGIAAGPITHPFYAPHGEFRIEDPDGYVIMVTHTSEDS
jgi:hypothetical protein